MSPGSSLDIGVSLVLPDSPGNFDVGTFAVGATVFDKQGARKRARERERERERMRERGRERARARERERARESATERYR